MKNKSNFRFLYVIILIFFGLLHLSTIIFPEKYDAVCVYLKNIVSIISFSAIICCISSFIYKNCNSNKDTNITCDYILVFIYCFPYTSVQTINLGTQIITSIIVIILSLILYNKIKKKITKTILLHLKNKILTLEIITGILILIKTVLRNNTMSIQIDFLFAPLVFFILLLNILIRKLEIFYELNKITEQKKTSNY